VRELRLPRRHGTWKRMARSRRGVRDSGGDALRAGHAPLRTSRITSLRRAHAEVRVPIVILQAHSLARDSASFADAA
jgi:hypothetical protein